MYVDDSQEYCVDKTSLGDKTSDKTRLHGTISANRIIPPFIIDPRQQHISPSPLPTCLK